ncbi:uncharacterized protein LOC125261114 isoform X2 [Megalobrama amblycephala]|uniref:uncharacterized protein LOC125261114 isoform X2 n=1 Tax=Megalobrama amblycephala TaxID=75352 RepID=UPI002013E3EE|nr:uncharacterized protein LOC125261114 isoform X2 [Megalobrama amblycephala]
MLETRRGRHDMDEGKEGETSFKSSMDESSGCTDGPEKKTKKVHQCSDDSDGTVTLDPTPDTDTSVPELRRTDSVVYYRLPEGTLQLAKIGKILMAMERGQLSEFKGRNLDEIQIDPQERVLMDSDHSDSENKKGITENDASDSPSNSADKSKKSTAGVGQHKNQQPPKGKNDKKLQLNDKDLEGPHTTERSSQNSWRKWSTEEIEAVEKTLMDCIRSGKVPGKAQCMECIESSPAALQGRSWEGVKFYVKNRIDSLKQKM